MPHTFPLLPRRGIMEISYEECDNFKLSEIRTTEDMPVAAAVCPNCKKPYSFGAFIFKDDATNIVVYSETIACSFCKRQNLIVPLQFQSLEALAVFHHAMPVHRTQFSKVPMKYLKLCRLKRTALFSKQEVDHV